MLPGIETAGCEEAIGRQIDQVLSCLRPRFYKQLLRTEDEEKTSSPWATDSGTSTESGASTRTGNSERALTVAPTWKELVESGSIQDVELTAFVDFRNRPRFLWFYLNVVFDLSWDPETEVGGLRPSADRFAIVEGLLLQPLKAYLYKCAKARGVHMCSKNRGKNRLFRVLSQNPKEWKLDIEFLMSLLTHAKCDRDKSESDPSAEEFRESPHRACLLMQERMTMLQPRMFRGHQEDFGQVVEQLVLQLLPLLSNCKRVSPPALSRLRSCSAKGDRPSSPAQLLPQEKAGETRGRKRGVSAEGRASSVWDGWDDSTRSLWVGTLDPIACFRILWQQAPSPSEAAESDSASRPPSSPRRSHGESEQKQSDSSSSALLRSHPDTLNGTRASLMGLRGKLGIDLRAEAERSVPPPPSEPTLPHIAKKKCKPSASSEKVKPEVPIKTEHDEESTAAGEASKQHNLDHKPRSPAVPWLQKRLSWDGRYFFLPGHDQASLLLSKIEGGENPVKVEMEY